MRFRRRYVNRISAFVLATALLMSISAPTIAQDATPTAADAKPLDLAAMALTPDDLDKAGFADFLVADGLTQSLDDRVSELAASGSKDPSSTRQFLSGIGWIRGYRSRLAHPLTAGGEDFDALVASGVTQYATESGSLSGYGLLSVLDSLNGEATPVADSTTIGDQSTLLDLGSTDFGDGVRHPGLRIVFLSGKLVGDIIVFSAPERPLQADEIYALAKRQLDLMNAVVDGDAPELSLKALRWRGYSISDPDVDNYLKLDGRTYLGLGDTKTDIAMSADTYKTAIDYYRYEAALSLSAYQYTSVVKFADKASAKTWVDGAFDRTEKNRPAGSTLELVPNAPPFADGSVMMKVTIPNGDGTKATGYAVFARSGDEAISVAFVSQKALSLAVITKMTATQNHLLRRRRLR